jgi:tetratricopeptide (TPR) repeat protein
MKYFRRISVIVPNNSTLRANLLYLSAILMVLFAFSSCSKKKNNFFSRSYHRTTTHFNGYFNAREAVNEAVSSYEDGRQENWEEPLPIIIYPEEKDAVSLYPAMDRAIEKCSKVIDRHSMLISKKQYNTWIDDSYLLMGISYFYKRNFPEAEETFKYITKQFKKEPIRHEANLWMARMAIEEKKYVRAQSLLDKLEQYKADFPKGMDQSYYEVYTHLYLKQKNYQDAIDMIQQATAVTKKKDRRARQTFLLAQLYDITGQSQRSVRRYADVVKMNPDYEMKFYAQINQALAFDSRSDSEQIRSQLNKLLRDEKYIEFRDQVYYALAEVEFAERNVNEGITMLLKSTEASVNNNRQKGKSFLRLATIYFDERNYEVASAFYDSTMAYLPTDYPDYPIIQATKESLSDLVYFLKMVDREDSLQTLAGLDESELNRKLRKIIRQKQDEEAERLRLEQEEREAAFQQQQDARSAQADSRASSRSGQTGKWYFYNEASKSIGFAEFKATYGQRELKDNWRRKNLGSAIGIAEVGDEPGESGAGGAGGAAIPTMDELKTDIPFEAEAMKASKDTMAYALFEVGKIYKDRLEDFDNAIETFEDLNVRLPGNPYEQVTYYQLYRLFLTKEEDPSYFPSDPRSTSAYYATLITEDFPESEFAQLIQDPDYMASNEQERLQEREAYESTFRQYRMRNYTEVLTACLDIMNNDTGNRLLPKYHLLRAMAIAGKKDRENYVKALREIVAKFPQTEEGEEAKRLLGLLAEEEKEPLADTKESLPEKKEEPKEDRPKGDYQFKEEMDHYFAVLVPNKGVKMNDLKNKVSDFNNEYFRAETFKVTNSFINSDSQILLVRTFENKEDAMHYFGAYENEDNMLTDVNDQGFQAFVITSKNFATLFKTKDIDGYVEFFKRNYKK